MILPPRSQIGPITPEQRTQIIRSSVVAGVYEQAVDRDSAYEKLKGKVERSATAANAPVTATQETTPTRHPQPHILTGSRRPVRLSATC